MLSAMKFDKLGFILSCLALILAVPLSVLGNVLTPKIRDWWAANTGQQRLNKRIQALQEKLYVAESDWCFTHAEWEIYEETYWSRQIVVCAAAVLLFGIFIVLFVQFTFFGVYGRPLLSAAPSTTSQPNTAQVETAAQLSNITKTGFKSAKKAIVLTVFFNVAMTILLLRREVFYYRNWTNRSQEGRAAIRKRIENLKSRLT